MSAAAASWPAEPSLDFLLDEGLGDAYLQDPFNKRTNSGPPPSSVRVDPEEGAELDPFAWSVTSSADPASQSADVSASGSASEGALRCVGAIAANQRSAAQQIAATSFAGLSNAAQRPADQTDAAAIGSSGRAPRRRSADTQRAAKGTVRMQHACSQLFLDHLPGAEPGRQLSFCVVLASPTLEAVYGGVALSAGGNRV